MIQREADFSTKQESNTSHDSTTSKISKLASSTSWSRLKDPRIVRVSRAFGGKDRHSKVCTVRGLRDRRVRLSVPTAIQLYDLQDRLGLNQPSKVVDWLLNAAKHEIDELPPLQIPPGTFNLHPMLNSQEFLKSKSSSLSGETSHDWGRSSTHHEEERQFISLDQNQNSSYFLSRQQNSISTSLLNSSSSSMPANYNPFVRWDPSSLTLSHPPRSDGILSSNEDLQNFSLVPFPSNMPHNHHHQVLVYHQPAGMSTTQSYFPSQIANNTDFDPKQLNFQLPNSSLTSPSTQPVVRPFHFSTAELLPSENNSANEQNNDENFRLG